jgi:hypothetical protein
MAVFHSQRLAPHLAGLTSKSLAVGNRRAYIIR